MILVHPGAGGAHGFDNAQPGQLRGVANEGDFRGAFDGAHQVQRGREVAHLKLRKAFLNQPDKVRFARWATIPRVTGPPRLSCQQLVTAVVAGFHGAQRRIQRERRRTKQIGAHQVRRQLFQCADLLHPGELLYQRGVLRGQGLPLGTFAPFVAVRQI